MAHIELVTYVAKRTNGGLIDISERSEVLPGSDPDKLLNELVEILAPGFFEYVSKVDSEKMQEVS